MSKDRIESLEALLALYPEPLATSVSKELSTLNELYCKMIKAAPFFTIASIGPDGMDCSPRGDTPGFVEILNDKTIIIPDRRGNNRLDTLRNIVVDPRVALLFLIPGKGETLRLNGSAYLSKDKALLNRFKVNGNVPISAIVVEIERVYFQCARALKRSGLWDASKHVDPSGLPSAGEMIKSAIKDFDDEAYDEGLQDRQLRTLY